MTELNVHVFHVFIFFEGHFFFTRASLIYAGLTTKHLKEVE